jgi:hypothetical protein
VHTKPEKQMTQPPKRKLIEVALPLETINREAAREKSIRHGHPSTLHLCGVPPVSWTSDG